jgi:hypothetical protein
MKADGQLHPDRLRALAWAGGTSCWQSSESAHWRPSRIARRRSAWSRDATAEDATAAPDPPIWRSCPVPGHSAMPMPNGAIWAEIEYLAHPRPVTFHSTGSKQIRSAFDTEPCGARLRPLAALHLRGTGQLCRSRMRREDRPDLPGGPQVSSASGARSAGRCGRRRVSCR